MNAGQTRAGREIRCPRCGAGCGSPPQLPWRQRCDGCGERFDVLEVTGPGEGPYRRPELLETRLVAPPPVRPPGASEEDVNGPRIEDLGGGANLRWVRVRGRPRAGRDLAWLELCLISVAMTIGVVGLSLLLAGTLPVPGLALLALPGALLVYLLWASSRGAVGSHSFRLDARILQLGGHRGPGRRRIPVSAIREVRLHLRDDAPARRGCCLEIRVESAGRRWSTTFGEDLTTEELDWLRAQLVSGLALVRGGGQEAHE
jgi:hypothetical protein